MTYCAPDGWPLPTEIHWYTCDDCGMIYGDGDFDQALLDEYYHTKYGYGVNNPENTERLKRDAEMIASQINKGDCVVDFGGSGDDGRSVIFDTLYDLGIQAFSVGPREKIPHCNLIYASHVLEHIYDLPDTMRRITAALAPGGLLIVDVPDATGILQRWKMPILDYNTKHINHFTLRNLLDLAHHHGLELVALKPYEMQFAPIIQAHFKRLDVARASRDHVQYNINKRVEALREIHEPVNIWGMSDIVWHVLSMVDLDVLDYIDNDPAYRGATFKGKPVLERPTNDAPIVILAQGQRQRLIANIRSMGIESEIIEI
jgi:hypothetical protein